MSDQIVSATVQLLSTFLGAIIGGGAVIYSQHLASSRTHAAKLAELEAQEEKRRNHFQAKTLITTQRLSNNLVSHALRVTNHRIRLRDGKDDGPKVMDAITDARESRQELASLTERVLDNETRARLRALIDKVDEYTKTHADLLELEKVYEDLNQLNQAANLRVGETLRRVV